MLSRLYSDAVKEFVHPISHVTRLLRTVEVSENGQIVRKSQFVDVSVCETYKEYFASDFSISNLIAVGAVGKLQPVSMRNSDVTGISKELSEIMSKSSENEKA